jgi:hypothetical protein
MSIMPPAKDEKNGNVLLSDEQLQDLLRPGKEFEGKLQGHLSTFAPGTANLVIVRVGDYNTAAHAILDYFQRAKTPGVYVTINKPYTDLIRGLSTVPENVRYVDSITALTGRGTPEVPRVIYLDSPLALVEMNLAIADELKKVVSNTKFLVVDSISTLLVYNSPQSVEKFCHTVIAKNRSENVIGVFLLIESEEHRSVVDTLAQFVDNVVFIR